MIPYDRLATIIPSDQALANKALAVSLQQITGISNMQLPSFAAAVTATQTMYGLPLVNAQTSAVAPSTAAYYTSTLAGGSSVNGTYVISDFLGTAAGIPGTVMLTDTLTQFSEMDLTYLTLIYQTMADAINGVYNSGVDSDGYVIITIPGGLPGAGTYTPVTSPNPDYPPDLPINIEDQSAISQVMPILIAEANAEIVTLVATYPTQTTQLNQDWDTMANALVQEPINQAKANLVWADLVPNNQSSILSLIQSLPTFGQDTAVGGQAQFFEGLADTTTLAGQCIIGLFRQGPTTTALNATGIYTNNNIPADPDPPPPQADLGPTTYPSN